MKNFLTISLGILQTFVGLTALVSGIMLVIEPSGSLLNAPLDMLTDSHFNDFFFPGLILLTVNGAGQLIAAFLTFRKHESAKFVGALFGFALMVWIFIQVNMIGGGHILQYSYFFIGVAETSFAFLLCLIQPNKSL